MKHLVSLFVAVLATLTLNAQSISISFACGESTLSFEEQQAILSKLNGATIDAIVGYASTEGQANQELSEARAAFVAAMLDADMSLATGAGSTNRFGDKAANRIVIVFYHKGDTTTSQMNIQVVPTVQRDSCFPKMVIPHSCNDFYPMDSVGSAYRTIIQYSNGFVEPAIYDVEDNLTITHTYVGRIYPSLLHKSVKSTNLVGRIEQFAGDTLACKCAYEYEVWVDAQAAYMSWLETWEQSPSEDAREQLAEAQRHRTKARTNYERCKSYVKRTKRDDYGLEKELASTQRKFKGRRLVNNGLAKRPSVIASHIACWVKGRKA